MNENNEEIEQGGNARVCDLGYLVELMNGKKKLILEMLDTFLKQVPVELAALRDAIGREDFPAIKSISHTMKSSVSIMGISTLRSVLQEMENLGGQKREIERIRELNQKVIAISDLAVKEIEKERVNYVE